MRRLDACRALARQAPRQEPRGLLSCSRYSPAPGRTPLLPPQKRPSSGARRGRSRCSAFREPRQSPGEQADPPPTRAGPAARGRRREEPSCREGPPPSDGLRNWRLPGLRPRARAHRQPSYPADSATRPPPVHLPGRYSPPAACSSRSRTTSMRGEPWL